MPNTTITLYGVTIPIRYSFNEQKQIQWFLDKDSDEMTDTLYIALEYMLRWHYWKTIEDQLSSEIQAHIYEADARAAATAADIPF